MTDQTLIMNKLNRWFWYFGVLPLIISYIFCLNFTAEYIKISLKFTQSPTEFYMGELLGFTTIGLACLMIFWCNINIMYVHKVASKITSNKFKNKKYILNISVVVFPIIAFLGFPPLAIILSYKNLYFSFFSIIEPIAQNLTPFFFPVYLFIMEFLEYIIGKVLYVY